VLKVKLNIYGDYNLCTKSVQCLDVFLYTTGRWQ